MNYQYTKNPNASPVKSGFGFDCFPYTTPLLVREGGIIVKVRLGNFMEDAHPIHIHGHQFHISVADGNSIPSSNRTKKHCSCSFRRDLGCELKNPGICLFHCHIPHYMSKNMTEGLGGMFITIVYVD